MSLAWPRSGAAWAQAALSGALALAAAVALAAALAAPVSAWLVPSAAPAAAGLAAAAAVRGLGGRVVRPLGTGLLVAALAWCLQWWPGTLLAGLFPGRATLEAVTVSARDLREVIWTETIPVATTDPVLAGIGAALAVAALVTDALAAGLHSPVLAGVPALVLIGGAAVLTAGAAPWPALVAAAAAWLGLLWATDRAGTADRSTAAAARGGVPAAAAWGRPVGTLVAGGAALAVLAAGATQLPMLSAGLAPEGRRFVLGEGTGPVNPAADLGRALRSDAGYTGISYRTEDGRGIYLRTAVVDDVYASPWGAVPPQGAEPPGRAGFEPAGARLAGGADRLRQRAAAGEGGPWTVVRVTLDDWTGQWAPLPDQVWAVEDTGDDWPWQVDPDASVAYRPDTAPATLDFRAAVAPLALDVEGLSAQIGPDVPPAVRDRWGAAPELDGSRIEALARQVTAGVDDPARQAAALQAYLTSGRFAYSETAPADRGYDGSGLEMTEQFLDAGAGYCIHYASAMTMMAQAVGIPARVVVGYAPVAPTGGGTEHHVTSDRAHSWPELYLGGIGWVPYEPTPGVGRTPAYAQRLPGPGPTLQADPALPRPTPAPGDASGVPPATGPGAAGTGSGRREDADAAQAARGLFAGAVALTVLAGVAAAPGALRTQRRRRRLGPQAGPRPGAEDTRQRIVRAWQEVEDTAMDLRAGRRPHESEPAFARRLAEDTGPDGVSAGGDGTDLRAVAAAVVDAVCWARYAPDHVPAPTAAQEFAQRVREFVSALERGAAPGARRRARWMPVSVLPTVLRRVLTAHRDVPGFPDSPRTPATPDAEDPPARWPAGHRRR